MFLLFLTFFAVSEDVSELPFLSPTDPPIEQGSDYSSGLDNLVLIVVVFLLMLALVYIGYRYCSAYSPPEDEIPSDMEINTTEIVNTLVDTDIDAKIASIDDVENLDENAPLL